MRIAGTNTSRTHSLVKRRPGNAFIILVRQPHDRLHLYLRKDTPERQSIIAAVYYIFGSSIADGHGLTTRTITWLAFVVSGSWHGRERCISPHHVFRFSFRFSSLIGVTFFFFIMIPLAASAFSPGKKRDGCVYSMAGKRQRATAGGASVFLLGEDSWRVRAGCALRRARINGMQ